MTYAFIPKGVCSRKIFLELDGEMVTDVRFEGGCNGNAQGVSQLAKNRTVDEVIGLLRGIDCGGKGTSCPDQLANALEEALKLEGGEDEQ